MKWSHNTACHVHNTACHVHNAACHTALLCHTTTKNQASSNFALLSFMLFLLNWLQSYLQLSQLYLCCTLLPFSSRLTRLDWRRKTTMDRRPKTLPVSVKAIESDMDGFDTYRPGFLATAFYTTILCYCSGSKSL
jgi:hypothetical protein